MSMFGKTAAACSTFVALAVASPVHAATIRMTNPPLTGVPGVQALTSAIARGDFDRATAMPDSVPDGIFANREEHSRFQARFIYHPIDLGSFRGWAFLHWWLKGRFHFKDWVPCGPGTIGEPPPDPVATPEPTSMALLGSGLLAAGVRTVRRRRRT
jgi:hypothetical protein